MPTGLGWVWSGCLALIASWLLTGCRLGNRLEYAEPKTLTGYYEMDIDGVTFCSTSVGANTICHAAPTNQVPAIAAGVFSNPVGLQMINEHTGEGMLIGVVERVAADIAVHVPTNAFDLGFTVTDPTIPYTSSTCNVNMDWDGEGVAVKGEHRVVGSYDTRGNVYLDLKVTTTFSGSCQALLTALRNCYQSEAQCGGTSAQQNSALYSRTHLALDPYVQNGVLALNQISTLESLSFRLTY